VDQNVSCGCWMRRDAMKSMWSLSGSGGSRADPVATLQELSDLDVWLCRSPKLGPERPADSHGGYARSIRRVRTCDSARTLSSVRFRPPPSPPARVLKVAFAQEVKSEDGAGAPQREFGGATYVSF
jgi:hypothetical protein